MRHLTIARLFYFLLLNFFIFFTHPIHAAENSPHNASTLDLGIHVLWSPDINIMEERLQKVQKLGLHHIRIDWEWRAVEKQQGIYDWTLFDELIQRASSYNITILPIIHYAPDWAVSIPPVTTGQKPPAAEHMKHYAAFVKASIDRYGPDGNAPFQFMPITHWQIWNEPNNPAFWAPSPDAAQYRTMLIETANAVKEKRHKIKLIHAGLEKADIAYLWTAWKENDHYYNDSFDIMAVHAYTFNNKTGVRPPTAQNTTQDNSYKNLGFIGNPQDTAFLENVFNLQLFMHYRGKHHTPIWITESGYIVGSHKFGLTEEQHSHYIQQAIETTQQKLGKNPFNKGSMGHIATQVERLYLFTLEDYADPSGMGTFGLYRKNGTERPAATTIKNITHDP